MVIQMFIIKIANLNIKINNKYPYLEKQCRDYIINSDTFDFEITVQDEEINEEIITSNLNLSNGYIESICCYRKIALILPKYDAFIMHAAVVKVDDMAYAFSAKSGTGKTTHIKLWKELLKDKLIYLNGDKPIVRIINNKPIIFGTPWCGKENYGTNTSAILKSLCFIERDLNNSIRKIDNKEILPRIIHQIILPSDEDMASKTLELLNFTILNINTYILRCNTDISSAELSYKHLQQ